MYPESVVLYARSLHVALPISVVDVEPRVKGAEVEDGFASCGGHGSVCATARACDGVEVDVVWHFAIRVVGKVDFDLVAFLDADHGAWNDVVEGPVGVFCTVIETHKDRKSVV